MLLRILFFLCLLASLPLRAQENPYESNRLDTLHYHTPGRTVSISADLQTATQDWQEESQYGQTVYDRYYSLLDAQAAAAYGITDLFAVGLGIDYLINQTESRTSDASHNSAGFEYGGVSNPTLQLSYRYFGGLTGSLFGTAFFNYSPSLGTNHSAVSDHETGNHLTGNSNLNFGTNWEINSGRHEFQAQIEAQYINNSTVEDVVNETETSFADAYWHFYASVNYRIHFQSNFYAGLNLQASFAHSYDVHYPSQSPEIDETVSDPLYVVPTVSVGWLVTPTCLLYAKLNYESYAQHISPTASSTFGTITNQFQQQFLIIGGAVEL